MNLNRAFLLDVLDRALSTYLQSFVALLAVDSTNFLSLGPWKAAAIAAAPAALAVVKASFKEALFVKSEPVQDGDG